jgi:hypothetical protein
MLVIANHMQIELNIVLTPTYLMFRGLENEYSYTQLSLEITITIYTLILISTSGTS